MLLILAAMGCVASGGQVAAGIGMVGAILGLAPTCRRRCCPPRTSFHHVDSVPRTDTTLSVIAGNLLIGNRRREQALAALLRPGCDMVVLVETTSADAAHCAGLADWAHQIWLPDDLRGGLAILSRHPLRRQHECVDQYPIALAAEVSISGTVVLLIACHPFAPESWTHAQQRNGQMRDIAARARASTVPVIVAGDFNCTAGNPAWIDFLTAAGLTDAGCTPATYPAVLGPLGIAIDHILVRNAAHGPLQSLAIPGSDHRGLRCGVQVPAGAAP